MARGALTRRRLDETRRLDGTGRADGTGRFRGARPGAHLTRSVALIIAVGLAVPASASGLTAALAAYAHGRPKHHRLHSDRSSLKVLAPPGGTLLAVSCSDTSWAAANGLDGLVRGMLVNGHPALVPAHATWPHRVPRNCVTVGDNQTRQGPHRLAAVRHETARWLRQASPNAGRSAEALFSAVSCPAAKRCIAVGSTFRRSGRSVPLAELWSGVRWSVLRVPSPHAHGGVGSALYGVSCRSYTNCLAVGDNQGRSSVKTLAESWNGHRWRILRAVNVPGAKVSTLTGVSCAGTRACMAVGDYGNHAGRVSALDERWNGRRWRVIPAASHPHSYGSVLSAASCPARGACVAVGWYGVSYNSRALAELWNGRHWRELPTPTPSAGRVNALNDVYCQSSRHCFAVGYHQWEYKSDQAIIEQWNGRRWVIQPAPGRGSSSDLYGVFCRSASRCIAVGDYAPTPHTRAPFAEIWNGRSWHVQSIPGS